MTRHFDLHDTISVMIPGACALALGWSLYCGSPAEALERLPELNVGVSLVLLALSYVIGELLQSLGEKTVKAYYRENDGGDPLMWLLPKEKDQEFHAGFLPKQTCEAVMSALKEDWGDSECSKDKLMDPYFPCIKATVYEHEVFRSECVKMLTKANFYSAMAVLFFLAPPVYGLILLFGTPCYTLSYCLTHDIMGIGPSVPMGCVEWLVFLFLSWGLGCASVQRYRFFNIIYIRCLISAYAVVHRNIAKKVSP